MTREPQRTRYAIAGCNIERNSGDYKNMTPDASGVMAIYRLSTFVYRHIRHVLGADVLGARTNQAVVGVLFNDVGCPTGDAAAGEDGCVQVYRNVHHVIGGGGVEVYIGIQALVRLHVLLDAARDGEPAQVIVALA